MTGELRRIGMEWSPNPNLCGRTCLVQASVTRPILFLDDAASGERATSGAAVRDACEGRAGMNGTLGLVL